jgi:hypothetical protein
MMSGGEKASLFPIRRRITPFSDLKSGRFNSIEKLASSYKLHPKVVRQGLGLAFLAPKITVEILTAEAPATLRLGNIPKRLSLPWTNHQPLPSQ